MAGGTWTAPDKILPGAYINVHGAGTLDTSDSGIGVVALPLALDYGPEMQFIEVTRESNFLALFGKPLAELKEVSLALQNTSRAIITNVNTGGVSASANVSDILFTAKYPGAGGKGIGISINNETYNTRVTTYYNGKQVDTQVIPTEQGVSGLRDNDYVTVDTSAATDFEDVDITLLTSGAAGTSTVQNYLNYLDELRGYSFYVLADLTADLAIRRMFENYVIEERRKGNYITLVTSNDSGEPANSEAISRVMNGFELKNGVTVTKGEAVAFIAGAMAGVQLGRSLTYLEIEGAVKTEAFSVEEQQQAILKGGIMFINNHNRVVVLSDVNTLTTYTEDRPKYFQKNIVMRTIDYLQRAIKFDFETRFIGKIQNDADGRGLFKQDVIGILTELYENNAIELFKEDDIVVSAGPTKESILVQLTITVSDAIEKLYLDIIVN